MRRLFAIVGVALVAAYALILLRDAGAFKTIRSHYLGDERGVDGCRSISGVPGPEDFARIGESGVLISSSPFPRIGEAPEGALYYLDLKSPGAPPRRLNASYPTSFRPHGLDVFKTADGVYRVAVVNHAVVDGKEIDEIDFFRFDPRTADLVFQEKVADVLLGNSVNDVVLTGPNRFYATLDHAATTHLGKTAEDYLRLGRGYLVYFDGARMTAAYRGIAFANGIIRLPETGEIVVASMLGKKILRLTESAAGSLSLRDEIALESGPDNLYYEAETRSLWIGAHPKLLDLKKASKDPQARSPSTALRIRGYGSNSPAPIEEVLVDSGERISALSLAVPIAGQLVFGAIYGDQILVCPMTKAPAGGP